MRVRRRVTDEPGDAASDLALERAPARLPPWRDLPVYLRGRLEAGVLLPDFTIVPGRAKAETARLKEQS